MEQPLLVTAYVHPDLDGAAGAVAYAEYLNLTGTPAVAGLLGTLHDEVQFVLQRFGIPAPLSLSDATAYARVALVDASDLNGLEGRVPPDRVVEIIDHRRINEAGKFPYAKVQIELVGAAATLVAEKFMQANLPISQASAQLLQAAIISNTLNFRGAVSTPRDEAAAQWLQRYSALPDGFWREMFIAKSDLTGAKLAARLDGDFAHFEFAGRKIGVAQIEIIGAQALLEERGGEIAQHLVARQQAQGLDYIFQNTIELEGPKNVLFAPSAISRALLSEALGVQFAGAIAEHVPALMRKQIMPKIKALFETA